jgi:FAD:protein FMN transferase
MYRTEFHAMGGQNEIVVEAPNAETASAAFEAAAGEVLRIQDKYSRYRLDNASLVQTINHRAGTGEWTECDGETMFLFSKAREFYDISEGLFDITSGILRKVWDFKNAVLPTPAQLSATLPLVGFPQIELQDNVVRLPHIGMEIDFGGLGKEYAADYAVKRLRDFGLKSGFVNLGGDIAVLGPQPNGLPWLIGLPNPRKSGEWLGQIEIYEGGLATSGDGQKYFVRDGRRFSHLLSPKSGLPPNCMSSVSVLSANCLMAGFLSTTAMLMESRAKAFLQQHTTKFLLVDLAGDLDTVS